MDRDLMNKQPYASHVASLAYLAPVKVAKNVHLKQD